MQQANTDMIKGSIFKSILWFSIPLLIGNFFQQLYNTVDSYVVGNFVDTNALAAVGASTPVINMLVGFFMGLSAGAGVVISQYFGGRRKEDMSVYRGRDAFYKAPSQGHRGAGGGAAAFLPVSDHLFCRDDILPVL